MFFELSSGVWKENVFDIGSSLDLSRCKQNPSYQYYTLSVFFNNYCFITQIYRFKINISKTDFPYID